MTAPAAYNQLEATAPPAIDAVEVAAYRFPTDGPEGVETDGTLAWDSTTAVVVTLRAGDWEGLGYTYADVAAANLVASKLAPLIAERNPLELPAIWRQLRVSLRNLGRRGITAMAISAVDIALHDLAAKILDVPLYQWLGAYRDAVPAYGSGGFCNYPLPRLAEQLGAWRAQGIPRVKIKTSRHPEQDPQRLRAAREAVGDEADLMTDANGALDRKQALYWAHRFREEWNVSWLEEPVSSDDLVGLRLLRDRAPAGMAVAAGEYAYDLPYVRRMLSEGAVDVMQLDASRCAGISGFLAAASVCDAFGIPVSSHCAPALHLHPGCAVRRMRHAEYFHDHARIEAMLFDGAVRPVHGTLAPDRSRPGLGLALKRADARRYAA